MGELVTTILVVEDDGASRRLTCDLLEMDGYETIAVASADDGIALARESAPDLIVMDIQLPGTDGLTATRILRRDERTAEIPILAVTAHAMRGDEPRILAAGCDGYLAKPLSYKEFLEAVTALLPPEPGSASDRDEA